MLLARPMSRLWGAMILAVLAAAIPIAAHAQSPADIDAANKRVEQLHADGKYAEATPIAEETLALAERMLGKEHRATLSGVANLALLYSEQGRDGEAEPFYRRALEVSERVLGPEDPDTLVNVNNLAVFYETRRRYAEAEPLMRRALEASERVLGPEHADTLTSVDNLAVLYQAQGRHEEAEPLLQRALEARERVLGKEHAETLASATSLAIIYRLQGRYGEAEPLTRRTLDAAERTLGGSHLQTLLNLNNLAEIYRTQERYAEAGPLFERAQEATERAFGKDHPNTLASLNTLAQFYSVQNRPGDAEPILKRLYEARERLFGIFHADTLGTADSLAGLYVAQSRFGEAEPLMLRSLEAREHTLGREHPSTLLAVNNLAELYRALGRYSAAEPLYKRALEARERLGGKEHPDTLASLAGLAQLFFAQGREGEAEPLMKHVLEAQERVFGKEHPNTLVSVNNLGGLYRRQGRYGEAEALYRRALEAFDRVLGRDHRGTIRAINNLAELYTVQGRFAEAEPLLKRALEANERGLGNQHRDTLVSVNNLAELYRGQGRYDEAEPLYRRAFESFERVLGLEHRETLTSAYNLANVLMLQHRYGDAEIILRGALAASERIAGGDPRVTSALVNLLAFARFAQSDWAGAAQFWRRGTAGIVQREQRGSMDAGLKGQKKSEAEQSSAEFWGLVKAVHRLAMAGGAPGDAASRESFQAAQWALGSEAARSLAQMAARSATGDPRLAAVARERQDLLAEWQTRDGLRNAALGETADKRNAKAETENLAQLAAIDGRIAEIDKRLAAEFPDFTALASPEPLSVEDVQAQLGTDEALVLFLDVDGRFPPTPEETFIWVVTRTDIRWVRSDLGAAALTREVQALRCGLDEEEWATPTSASRCGDLLGSTEAPDLSRPLPFHLGKAHALYQALFGQIEDIIAGKRLLIVPSGALTTLPFQALVTKAPQLALPETFEGYRGVAWLGRANAITTLPAVSSLKALRQHAAARQAAAEAYAGYGNPLLSGDGGLCRSAQAPAACPGADGVIERSIPGSVKRVAEIKGRATVRGSGGRRSVSATIDEVFAKGSTAVTLLGQVRGLCPLPDTAYEITCVAERFKAKAPLVRLAGEATEADIKALSQSGKLARYRILHLATHGLLSGDVEKMTQRHGEPALVLTPPDVPANDDDDGLLKASEVAALKLNADWVVLSACNTAAGDKIGAQALSGLARAFFYAGGRALLVSHWPVYSDAAVRLTTRAFAELDRKPKAGRAEALRNAMIALMDDRSQTDNAHPAVWAPFIVVGEGADPAPRSEQRDKERAR